MIPKILHRIWLGPNPLPREIDFSDDWTRLLPGWELKLWTNDNLPEMVNRAAFDAAPHPGMASNIVRYEVLHRFGGVYADCDVKPLQSPTALWEAALSGPGAFAVQHIGPLLCGAVQGAAAGHPLYARIIELLPGRLADARTAHFSPISTGHVLLRQVADELNTATPGAVQVFPAEVFCPVSFAGRVQVAAFDAAGHPDALTLHLWRHDWQIAPASEVTK